MKTYKVTEQQDQELNVPEEVCEGTFAKLAFEWNYALLVGVGKLWGETVLEPRTKRLH